MSTVIKLKRGTSTPTTSDIVSGEVAIDTSAQKFYVNDSGSIKLIGDGTGRFAHQSKDLPQGKHTNAFASTIADFNGDGCGDVVMSNYKKSTHIWIYIRYGIISFK